MSLLTQEQCKKLHALPLEDCVLYWNALEDEGRKNNKLNLVVRGLVLADLYYMLVRVCGRTDMLNDFAFARCREVEASPNNHIDLWSRGHFKSSIGTFGLTIQKVLRDPEITIMIASHTRPIAKAFLRQIMRELETNKALQAAFPDVLWGTDIRQAPKWSEDEGVIVKRKGNPPESTIEAWGIIDGQPTARHFKDLVYDDLVVEGSVSNPEMIAKTTKALEQSYNLVNVEFTRRFYGTRWHFNDSYRTVIDRGTATPRIYPCTDDGTEDGEPVFWTQEMMDEKRRDMGPYVFAAQCLLNPKADALQGFKREWLRHYKRISPDSMNWYLCVDAASSKKKGSDYTAMWAIGLGRDRNYYCIPEVRDRLNLKERGDRLFKLHRRYKPKQVRYEKYGLMSDVEHYQARMENENYRFQILEVAGQTSKKDRIKRLVPLFEAGRIWLPESHTVTDWQKTTRDLVHDFIEEEYYPFPVGLHDDMLDSLARIAEPELHLIWPQEEAPKRTPRDRWMWMDEEEETTWRTT